MIKNFFLKVVVPTFLISIHTVITNGNNETDKLPTVDYQRFHYVFVKRIL